MVVSLLHLVTRRCSALTAAGSTLDHLTVALHLPLIAGQCEVKSGYRGKPIAYWAFHLRCTSAQRSEFFVFGMRWQRLSARARWRPVHHPHRGHLVEQLGPEPEARTAGASRLGCTARRAAEHVVDLHRANRQAAPRL